MRRKLSKAAKKQRRKKTNAKHYKKVRHGTFDGRLTNCLYSRKSSAKKKRVAFEVDASHFTETLSCPLLPHIDFNFKAKGVSDHSMSIDRINPLKGYVPGNVWLISAKANRIKNNATFEEFEMIYLNWRAYLIQRGELP